MTCYLKCTPPPTHTHTSTYTEHCLPNPDLSGLVLCPQEFTVQPVTLDYQETVTWPPTIPLCYTSPLPQPLKEPGKT